MLDDMSQTDTPPPAGPPPGPAAPSGGDGPRVSRSQLTDVTRLRRTTGPYRHIAGVGGGLARHFDIDPLLVRVILVVMGIFGVGLLLYAGLWLLLPDDDGPAIIDLDERSLAVALIVLGLVVVLPLLGGDTWGVVWVLGPMALLALIIYAVVGSRRNRAPRWQDGGSWQGAQGRPYGQSLHGWQGQAAVAPPGTPGAQSAQATAAPSETTGATTVLPEAPYGGDAGGGQTPPWQPAPVWQQPPPPDPKKRGPILFWVTLALISLGIGILGVIDVSGNDVTPSAYPALALAISAVMLLVGSVWGRAGGIILLGLLAVPATVIATAVEHADTQDRLERPVTAAQVEDDYRMNVGNFTLDLTDLEDPSVLDGRHLDIQGGIGRIEVIVADDMDVRAQAEVGGPGHSIVFGDESGFGQGSIFRRHRPDDAAEASAIFWVNVGLGVGEIQIVTESESETLR